MKILAILKFYIEHGNQVIHLLYYEENNLDTLTYTVVLTDSILCESSKIFLQFVEWKAVAVEMSIKVDNSIR